MDRNISNTDILLESGTNELEVLEFIIAGNSYGINVAKVMRLMQAMPVQPLPRSHVYVKGIIQPRDEVYTVVDLPGYLGLPDSETPGKDIFLIASFNQMNIAFHVHGVEVTHRISWEDIEKPDATIYGGDEGIVTGIAKVRDRIIAIIDFEKIVFDISPETGIQIESLDALGERERNERPVLIAEDSEFLRRMLLESLHKAGYTSVTIAANGKEAWDILQDYKRQPGPLEDKCCILITDIEMPQMDGHRLTKQVRADPELQILPIIIFSSLIDDQMRIKGEELGATAQLSKPEIAKLVTMLDQYIL